MSAKALHSAFVDFKYQKNASAANTHLVVLSSLRNHYPNHHVVSVNPENAEFLEFADAGYATATLDLCDDHVERARKYLPSSHGRVKADGPKGSDGSLGDEVFFGRWAYVWREMEFELYRASWEDNWGTAVFWWFVVFPKHPDTANPSPRKPGSAAEAAEDQAVADDDDDNEQDSGFDSGPGNCPEIDRLLLTLGRWTSVPHNDIYVFEESYWRRSKSTWAAIQGASWDDVILDPAVKSQLMADVQGFFSPETKALFKSLSVPYKRGIILHGVPGNGKTISVKALITHLMQLKEPVPALYVKSIVDKCAGEQKSIQTIFKYARRSAPCLLIFEDLDSLVTDEVRSYFLNEVDGLDSNDGILMIGSTNHLEKLDSAVTKRPSRFDRKYAFRLPEPAQRESYAQYWREKLEKTNSSIDYPNGLCPLIAQLTDGFSFAYLKELFIVTILSIMRGCTGDEEWDVMNASSAADSTRGVESDDEKPNSGNMEKEIAKEASDEKLTEKGMEKEEEQKPKRSVPTIATPDSLKDNVFWKILQQQVAMLLKDMDDSDESEKEKLAKEDKQKVEADKATEKEKEEKNNKEHCQACSVCKTCGK
jgi:hypothetical protein